LPKESLKDKIIQFVLNSPEEENMKIAVFIAGMQAQKKIEKRKKRVSTGGSAQDDMKPHN
jgi:hypothetical protein